MPLPREGSRYYHLEKILVLLKEGFAEDDLRLLCFDHPDFRPLDHKLSSSDSPARLAKKIVDYASQKCLFDSLLAWAKEKNPKRYELHESYFTLTKVYIASDPSLPHPDHVVAHLVALTEKGEYRRWADKPSADEASKEHYIFQKSKILLTVSPYDNATGQQSEELLQTIRKHKRLLILGEPGMGKTVALERIMWETAQAIEPTIVVPIFVPLLYLQDSLIERVRIALNETGQLQFKDSRAVQAFLHQTSCLIMFDGLNEIPRESYERWQPWQKIANFLDEYPKHRYIITSRSQDELWKKLRAARAINDIMVIQYITDEQARDYLIAHLGDQDGGKLYNGLNERLRELARIPLLLWMIKEAGLANKKSPGNRGELFELFVNQMLTRDEKLEFKLPWRTKRRALVHLAFTLQQERGQLVCTKDRAREIVTQDMKDYGPEMIELILRESLGHGLLQGDEQQVRFLHQSVQEYFVGLALSKEIQDYNQLPLWKKLVTRSPSSKLATWAKEEWWAESIVQMAGLTEDPSWLAQELVQVQPWLAFWCSIDGKPIDEKTQLIVKAKTVDLLHSEDTEQRRKAVEELRRIKNPRTIKYLIKVLDDEDENVRNITTQALAELGEAAVEPLLESLVSNENGHQAAIRALGQIWGLIDLIKLGGSNQKDQAGAARALGELKDKRIVEPLIATLKDSDEEVRLEVVKALGNLRDSRAVESLITVLKNHDKEVRSRAAEALGEQRNIQALEPLIAALKDTYKEVRASAAEALGKLEDERAAEFLIAVLSDTDENVRQMTILGLGYIWHLSDLIQLGNNDSKIRLRAAEVLGELGDKRVVEPLIATLKDSNELVRAAAVKALGKLRDVRVIEPLIATLDDPNQQVRLIVTGVLRNMGEVESHINNLKSPEWYVRLEAVEVLGKLGDPQAVESIIITLRDNDELVRAAAVEALGKLRDARAIEPLIAILKDQDEGIRRRVVEALVKLGDATVEPLIATLDDNIWYVRFGVIEVLEELKDTRAIKPLTTLLLGSFLWGWGKDREPRVRWVAARALGNFNDEQVVKALKNACKDSDQRVRVESIAALRRIGTPEALAAVQEYEAREK